MIRTRFPDPPVPDFTPVPRAPRRGGWTAERQRSFIAALAATGSVTAAADAVGMHVTAAYKLRTAEGAESFCAAWSAALDAGVAALKTIAFDRAVNGVPVAVVWKGQIKGETTRYDNRLLVSVLRHFAGNSGTAAPAGAVPEGSVEPADVATRLWHNAIRYAEQQTLSLMFRKQMRDRLIKLAAFPDALDDWVRGDIGYCEHLEENLRALDARVDAGPEGMREAATRIRLKIAWSPLSESQQFVAAQVLARLRGQPEPEGRQQFPPAEVMETVLGEIANDWARDGSET